MWMEWNGQIRRSKFCKRSFWRDDIILENVLVEENDYDRNLFE